MISSPQESYIFSTWELIFRFLSLMRLIRTISLQFIVESQTWYQNDRGVMLISNQSDAKIIGLGSRVIIGLNWP